jgi:hypothetical protein
MTLRVRQLGGNYSSYKLLHSRSKSETFEQQKTTDNWVSCGIAESDIRTAEYMDNRLS